MIKKSAFRILCAILMFAFIFGTNTFAESDTSIITKNSDKEAVKEVQQLLIATGFLPEGEADGIYGSMTESAVRSFQESAPSLCGVTLTVTGSCDAETLAQLRKAAAQQTPVSETEAPGSEPAPVQESTDGADPALVEELAGYEKVFDEYISYLDAHPIDDSTSSSYVTSSSDDEETTIPDTTELSERSNAVSEYISAYAALRNVALRNLSEADRAYYNGFKARIDQKLSDAGIG